jgi:hypothetical protein
LNNREYKLKPTINTGGISGRGKMPLQGMDSTVRLGETQQHARNRMIMEMQQGRH